MLLNPPWATVTNAGVRGVRLVSVTAEGEAGHVCLSSFHHPLSLPPFPVRVLLMMFFFLNQNTQTINFSAFHQRCSTARDRRGVNGEERTL